MIRRRRWTTSEVRLLETKYGPLKAPELARLMDRTPAAVRQMAQALGVADVRVGREVR